MKPLRPPRQRRSEATLARFFSATHRLLEQKPFERITVNDIVREAGSSVGAFYARFGDKEGLLQYMSEVSVRDAVTEGDRQLRLRDWESAPLESVVRELIRVLVKHYRQHAGTLRAVSVRAIMEGRAPRVMDGMERSPHRAIVETIRRRRGEIEHPDPDVALHLGLRMVESAVRERVLFPELASASAPLSPITDAVFVEELTRAFIGFLGVHPKEKSR